MTALGAIGFEMFGSADFGSAGFCFAAFGFAAQAKKNWQCQSSSEIAYVEA